MTDSRALPKYRCHKEVWAFKIKDIHNRPPADSGGAMILPAEEGYDQFLVPEEYMVKHLPKIGGYYVIYADGYHSYSPAPAFEEGYAKMTDETASDTPASSPAPMIPSIGRIVHYRVPAYVAVAINQRRKDAQEKMDWHRALRTGAQVHVGNEVHEDDVFPLIITRVWGSTPNAAFNGQVFLDGNDLYWVTSTSIGTRAGECQWPARS